MICVVEAHFTKNADYRTGIIGKSHLQSFTGLPATNTFKPEPDKIAPPPQLRDAIKNNRHSTEYDLDNDPHEIHNLFDEATARPHRESLNEIMLRRLIELQDRSPLPAYRA